LRLARTLLVAVPSVSLSAAAHASAGGCVTALGVALIGTLLVTSTWTQLSRERSSRFLMGWLGLAQLLGHGLLEMTCHGRSHAAGPALPMLALHGLAVVLTAVLLAWGERRLWALARLLATLHARMRHLAARFVRRDEPTTPTAVPAARPAARLSWHASPWCSLRPVRRGPPGLALSSL
jgi:hypothetical protein